jgi:ribonuclease M5
MSKTQSQDRIRTGMAIIVEGKDDVDAVSRASDDLIIPTHGFGIRETTWEVMEKAYREIGVIILTDPDHAGEAIRRRLTERFPDAVQCYMAREEAEKADDIGIENARPEDIRAALEKAMELHGTAAGRDSGEGADEYREVTMSDLTALGLSGTEGAAELRNAVCRELGIGYCNARMLLTRLRGFRIRYDALKEHTYQKLNEKKQEP